MLRRIGSLVISAGIAAVIAWGQPGGARADMSELITSLYGGNGITLPTPTFHDAHYSNDSLNQLGTLNDDISRATTFAPFNSSATSVTFDIREGIPVRTKNSLGPLLAERAQTVGQGRVTLGLSYTRIDYQRFEGDDLNDLSVTAGHVDCCSPNPGFDPTLPPTPPGMGNSPFLTEPDGELGGAPGTQFELDTIRIDLDVDLDQEIFASYITMGITDSWDVGAVVPIIQLDGKVKSEYEVLNTSGIDQGVHDFIHPKDTDPTSEDYFLDSNRESATGVGDIRLRTKYNLQTGGRWGEWTPETAIAGQVKLPSGDEDDLLGTGDYSFLGVFIASAEYGIFRPHLNIGYEAFTSNGGEHNLRYAASTEVVLHERVTGIAEVIGRWEPDGDGDGDLVDFSFGAKWNPIGDMVLTSNFLVPINKDTGLRPDFIWGLAVELGF